MSIHTGSRRGRRWLRVAGIAAVIFVVLVALAPTLVTWTFGRGLVAQVIRDSVNGDVTVASVRFGWTSPQRVSGLRIDDRAGGNRISADVEVRRSLLSLITDPLGELDVTASADVTTTQAADGSLGLSKLVKPSPSPSTPSTGLPRTLVVALELQPSSFTIDQGADGSMTVSDLAGALRFTAADGSISADLKGRVGSPAAGGAGGAPTGTLALSADLQQIVGATGEVSIGAARGTAALTVRDTAMRYDGAVSELALLDAKVDAADGARPVAVTIDVRGAKRETIDVAELSARAQLGRDPRGPLGLSSSDLTITVEKGELAVRGGDEPFAARGVTADVALGSGGRATFKVAADTAIGERRGSIAGEGSLERLFDEHFGLTLASTTGSATFTVTRAVVPAGAVLLEIETLAAALEAADAAAPIRVNVDGRGTILEAGGGAGSGAPPAASLATSLVARASLARDARSPIGLSTDPRAISGEIDAHGIPSAILRPFLPPIGGVAVDPQRDIGPVIDLTAKATGGAAAPISMTLQSERLRAELAAAVDPESGSVRDAHGRIDATVDPALLAATPLRAGAPLGAQITFSSLALPRRDGAIVLDDAAVEADASIDGAFSIGGEGGDLASLANVVASLRSKRLADGASVSATAQVDGVPTDVVAEITGLRGLGTADFRVEAIRAKGNADVGPVDWSRPPVLLREAAPRLAEFGLAQTGVKAVFDGGAESGAADVSITDGSQSVATRVEWNATRLRTGETKIGATLTNALLDALALKDFRLVQPAPLRVTIEPLEVAYADLRSEPIVLPDVRAAVQAPTVGLAAAPGIAEPVTLSDLDAKLQLRLGGEVGVDVDGSMGLRPGARAAAGGTPAPAAGAIATTTFSFHGSRLAVPERQWKATIASKDLDAAALLRVAGVDPARVPGVAPGERGTLDVEVATAPAGALALRFDTAVGAARGSGGATLAADGAIAVPGAELAITLDAAKSTAFFSAEKDAHGHPLISRAGALPVALSLRDVLIPAPGADGVRPIARARASATLTTGNVDFDVAHLGTVRVGAIDGRLAMPGDGRSLDLRATSALTSPRTGTQPLSVHATLTDFATPQGAFDWSRLALAGEARMKGLPVALIDVVMDGDGTYESAIGPQLDVDVTAAAPPRGAGSALAGTIKSEYLVIDLGRVMIQDGKIVVADASPVTMALIPNETLRQRILKPINPIFADIRPQEGHPLMFSIDAFDLPADMNLRDFNAHFSLTVGDVEFQRSGAILNLMQLVREDADGIIPGNISPLDVTVTDGRLYYDNFTISIGRIGQTWNQQIFSSGDVDLASTPMYATAINVDYPIVGIGRLAAGATRFDAFFGRVNQLLARLPLVDANMVRVRATFRGPIEPGRELDLAFEPVLVMPPGSNPVQSIVDGIFGDRGILRIPSREPQGGEGGTTGEGDGGSSRPRDPVRGIFDDIFRRR